MKPNAANLTDVWVPSLAPDPYVTALNQTAQSLAEKLDDELRKAVTVVFGTDWQVADLVGRMKCLVDPTGKIETYVLDGRPILELHPIESGSERHGDSYRFTATRKYRSLV